MIPLEKLIEYKGNRYEITKAMIELARNGKNLLKGEMKYKKSKYIPVVIYNILEGKIKFDYKNGTSIIDDHAPFMSAKEEYDETIYEDKLSEELTSDVQTMSSSMEDDDITFDEDDDDEDDDEEIEDTATVEKEEKPKTKRVSKKTKS